MELADRTAVVLSGGSAYGAFAVGVMKALFAGRSPATGHAPLEANLFSGTSVGAFNAAVMVSNPEETGLQASLRLENLWLDRIAERPGGCGNGIFRVRGDFASYLDPRCFLSADQTAADILSDAFMAGGYVLSRTANFLASSARLSDRFIDLVNLGALVDPSPYHRLLRDVIQEDRILQSSKRLQITATDWIIGKPVYFTNSDFHDHRGVGAIMASTALPGVFPPVIVDGDVLVDGGIVENTPLQPAIDQGATTLHVIYLDPEPQLIPLKAQPSTLDTLLRVYYLMLATTIEEDIDTARWINAGIRALARCSSHGSISDGERRDLIRVAGQLLQDPENNYKTLTLHRYFPTSTLGSDLGMLDFRIDRIAKIVAEGEVAALNHDCSQNGCVVE